MRHSAALWCTVRCGAGAVSYSAGTDALPAPARRAHGVFRMSSIYLDASPTCRTLHRRTCAQARATHYQITCKSHSIYIHTYARTSFYVQLRFRRTAPAVRSVSPSRPSVWPLQGPPAGEESHGVGGTQTHRIAGRVG